MVDTSSRRYRVAIPQPSSVLLHSRALLAAVFAAAVAVGGAAALAPDVLLAVDRPVSQAVRGTEHRDLFRTLTQVGSTGGGLVFAGFAAAVLWPRCRAFAVMYPLAIVAASLLDVALKVLVDRPRPLGPLTGVSLGSFPSGHVLRGAVLLGLIPPALYVLNRSRRVFWASVPVAVVGVLLTMLSRVYLGAHWPSDVLASALIGAFLLLGAEYALASPFGRRHCRGCMLHPLGGDAEGGSGQQRPREGRWVGPP